MDESERASSRKTLRDYVNTYAFLAQLLSFTDVDLEKLYVYAKFLRRYLPIEGEPLPLDVQEKIDLESYRVSETFHGDIALERGNGEVEPATKPGPGQTTGDELEPLSAIIAELNDRFGADLTDEDKVTISHLEDLLGADETLKASIRVNPPETARLAFDTIVQDRLQEIVETNFKLYKRVADDEAFATVLVDWLYDRFRKEAE